MNARPLYVAGRAGSLPGIPGTHPGRPDHDLVMRLRAARADGGETMTAVEEYDPDFCLRLSACTMRADADKVVQDWFERHVSGLKRAGETFMRIWGEGRGPTDGTNGSRTG